ncbi:MAG: hypothetical protein WD049_06215 [Candidatus Paceibacterota bacterium]
MRLQFQQTGILFLFLGLATTLSAVGQEAASVETADEPSDRFRAEALAYEFTDLASGKPFELQPRSLLHWSNPARRGEDGMVFLWTDGSKPCVVGTFFTYTYKDEVRRKQSFRVLTNDAIQAKNDGRVIWNPPKDTVEYRPLANAPPPAPTPFNAMLNCVSWPVGLMFS